MNFAVGAALAACLAFAAAGPYLARVLPPAAAVRMLVPAALLSASCAMFVLATVAFTLIGQLTEVAEYGRWSAHTLHVLDPIPAPVALAAGGFLLIAVGWTVRNVWRTGRALLAAQRLCRDLDADPDGSPVVVVEDARPEAFTTPNLRARIVVTTGMLAALDLPGRRVLLAHEQSHRAHRHTWWVLAAELAAAVNPLLGPTARAVRGATERWADEDAASVSDRRLVATTIARVALLGARPSSATVAAATGGHVPGRVAALLHAPPRLRTRPLLVLIAVTLAVLLGALAVERTGETLFEHAKRPASITAPARMGPIR